MADAHDAHDALSRIIARVEARTDAHDAHDALSRIIARVGARADAHDAHDAFSRNIAGAGLGRSADNSSSGAWQTDNRSDMLPLAGIVLPELRECVPGLTVRLVRLESLTDHVSSRSRPVLLCVPS